MGLEKTVRRMLLLIVSSLTSHKWDRFHVLTDVEQAWDYFIITITHYIDLIAPIGIFKKNYYGTY